MQAKPLNCREDNPATLRREKTPELIGVFGLLGRAGRRTGGHKFDRKLVVRVMANRLNHGHRVAERGAPPQPGRSPEGDLPEPLRWPIYDFAHGEPHREELAAPASLLVLLKR